MIEPVFADTKFNRRCDRLQRRGRSAARSEWRLITATTTAQALAPHNGPAARLTRRAKTHRERIPASVRAHTPRPYTSDRPTFRNSLRAKR